jgi:hypothetical protein
MHNNICYKYNTNKYKYTVTTAIYIHIYNAEELSIELNSSPEQVE